MQWLLSLERSHVSPQTIIISSHGHWLPSISTGSQGHCLPAYLLALRGTSYLHIYWLSAALATCIFGFRKTTLYCVVFRQTGWRGCSGGVSCCDLCLYNQSSGLNLGLADNDSVLNTSNHKAHASAATQTALGCK